MEDISFNTGIYRHQSSVLAIPPIGAAESLPRLRGKGVRAATRASRATTAGPDIYVVQLSTPAAALELAGTVQASAGPFTDPQGNDVGSVSIQTNGFEVIVSTDSTPAMTAFLNALNSQH